MKCQHLHKSQPLQTHCSHRLIAAAVAETLRGSAWEQPLQQADTGGGGTQGLASDLLAADTVRRNPLLQLGCHLGPHQAPAHGRIHCPKPDQKL